MNQELKVMNAAVQTPELAILLSRFEHLNMSISDLSSEIAFHINAIKRFKSDLNLADQTEREPEDVLSQLNQQLNRLESSKDKLEEILNHVKTIV